MLALKQEVEVIMGAYGPEGPTKPKHALDFTRDLCYDKVGGQHLTASCMFCNTHLMSTGSTRIVDHFAKACVLCPPAVRDFCVSLRSKVSAKRERKEEHTKLVVQEQDTALRVLKAQKTELRQQSIRAGFKSADL